MATVSSASSFFGAGTGSTGTGASAGLGGSPGGLAAFQDLLGSLLGGGLGDGALGATDDAATAGATGLVLASAPGKDLAGPDGTLAGKTLVLTVPAALLNASADQADIPALLKQIAAGEKLDLAALTKDGVPVQDLTVSVQLVPGSEGKPALAFDGMAAAGDAKPLGVIEIALPPALQETALPGKSDVALARQTADAAAPAADVPADLTELALITLVPPRVADGAGKPPAVGKADTKPPAVSGDSISPPAEATVPALLVLSKLPDTKAAPAGGEATPPAAPAVPATAAPLSPGVAEVTLEDAAKTGEAKPAADTAPAPTVDSDDTADGTDAQQAAMMAALMTAPTPQPHPTAKRSEVGAELPALEPAAQAPGPAPAHPQLAPKPPAAPPTAPEAEPEDEAREPLAPRTATPGKKAQDSVPVLAPAAEPTVRPPGPPAAATAGGEPATATATTSVAQGPSGDPGSSPDGGQDGGRRPAGGGPEITHPQGLGGDAPRAPTAGDFASQLSAASRPSHAGGAATMPAVQQVAVHLNRAVVDGEDRLRIQLRPLELGRIDVQLHIADGRVSAHITADNASTLDLLQKDARGLEKALQDAGLQTDSGSLSFNLRDEGRQAHDNPGARHSGAAARFNLDAPTDTPDDDLPVTRLVPAGRVDVRV